ncbi:phage tail tape measure protein [Helicobacter sp. 14348-15]|uniref:phage tail tape measure protein n=1 Tax=Helicobacter colisuis TaxID=2949739 RepID=UPI00202B3893|nr:phage tail tape measure protein [Helicobacter colisuis]MCL9820920.1 phage tail tape measure protein [Helicobacter colisuis]
MQNLSLGVKIGFAIENTKLLSNTQKQLSQIGKSLDSYREKIDNFKGSLLEKVATAGALIAPIKVAIDFESSMAEVKKVTELSKGHSLEALSEDILNLSKRLPMAVDGIAALVAEGGKLGLASKEALKFGEVAASMGVAFEISAEEAGENIGKMMASLGANVEGIKRLGDSMNFLADKGASDGKNLIEIISRMGGTAKVIGLSEDSMVALAATLDEVGLASEVAGTALNDMFMKLSRADTLGADEAFARLGLSAGEMREMMARDSSKAIKTLLESIKQLDSQDQINTIGEIFGTGDGTIRSIIALSSNVERYTELVKMASSEEKKGSMDRELINKATTTASVLQIMGNHFKSISITLGQNFLPIVKSIASGISWFLDGFESIIKNFPTLSSVIFVGVGAFMALSVAIPAVLFAWNLMALNILTAQKNFILAKNAIFALSNAIWVKNAALIVATLSTKAYNLASLGLFKVLGILATGFKALGGAIAFVGKAMLLNPIGLIITAISALIGGVYLVYKHWGGIKEFFAGIFSYVGGLIKSFIEGFKSVFEFIGGAISGVKDFFGFGEITQKQEIQIKTPELLSPANSRENISVSFNGGINIQTTDGKIPNNSQLSLDVQREVEMAIKRAKENEKNRSLSDVV